MKWNQILTADAQRRLDVASIESGTAAEVLMESAGSHAADWMLTQSGFQTVVVLAGPGGNGGDGFVVARRLIEDGKDVRTISRSPMGALAGATRTMAERLAASGGPVGCYGEDVCRDELCADLASCDWIVDAWFGSGLGRPLQGEDATLVEAVNAAQTPVVSLDLPSGLLSDDGRCIGPAIHADDTLAMQYYKLAHWLEPAAKACGCVHIVAVDYPEDVLAEVAPVAVVPTQEAMSGYLPARPRTGHKGTFGKLLVVGGSERMKGAAVLACRAALRAGTGLVTLMHPESIAPSIAAAVPEALTLPMPDRDGAFLDTEFSSETRDILSMQQVLAVGPGIGRTKAALAFVRRILHAFDGPVVLDADALHAIAGDTCLLKQVAGRAVLTPHPGEMAQLANISVASIQADRLKVARSFAVAQGVVLLLKGRPTVTAFPNGQCVVNPTGNQGLATGGSGDVLTGLLGGLIAAGVSVEHAAALSAYVHGAAADCWASRYAARTLIPSDLVDLVPEILKEIES